MEVWGQDTPILTLITCLGLKIGYLRICTCNFDQNPKKDAVLASFSYFYLFVSRNLEGHLC
jgi:hypothetical protein